MHNVTTTDQNINQIVIQEHEGALRVTSRQVADSFGKQHKDVIRAIRNLECSGEFSERNFAPFKTNDLTGESVQHYDMTRDGFTFLAMGFTGKEAARWKETYILAFNAMEQRIKAGPLAIDLNDPEQLRGLLGNYAERTQIAEAKLIELEPQAEAMERLEASEGSMVPRLAAKALDFPERKFTKWLEINSWAFRQSGRGPLQAYSERRKQGYLEHEPKTYLDPGTGEEKTRIQMRITPKGLARLAKVLPREGGAA